MKHCTSSLWLQMCLGSYTRYMNCVSVLHKRHLHYPLPWPRIDHRSTAKYFLGRIVGKAFLRGTLCKWSEKEFLAGAEYAIKEFANMLHTPELREGLKNITNEKLHSCIKNSLDKIQPTWTLGLQVHEISNLAVGDIQLIAGMAPDGKEHIIDILGHRIVTSRDEMESILKESGGKSGLSLQDFSKIITLSYEQKVQFQIDVIFNMTELYWLTNEDGAIVEGSKDCTKQSSHKWTFGSEFNRTAEYPFSWIITNINDLLPTKHTKLSEFN